MAYQLKFTDFANKGSITVEDNTLNTDTSLSIPGRNRTDYGVVVGESFLHLLENFANTTEPVNPVEGQLWYDTTAGINQLKLYDGTTWIAAGGLKKAQNEPDAANSVVGDLWVDTDNQQLYLFTGSGWILVGPQFSDGLNTGVEPIILTGTDNVDYTVLRVDVQAQPVAIISADNFSPKTTITGFEQANIRPGVNLSTNNITGAGVPKFYGTAEKAENLVVGNETVPASSFVRTDIESVSTSPLRIKNNNGVQLGASGELTIGVEAGDGIIQQNVNGSSIAIKVNDSGTIKSVITVDSDTNVGINNSAPAEAMDVTGNIHVTNNVYIDGTDQSTNFSNGTVIVKGGVGIARNLNVGGDVEIEGLTTAQNIVPDITNQRNLGNQLSKYANVYATNFVGNLVGNVSGAVTGRAGSADKLSSASTFQLIGDVSAPSFSFDGQVGGSTKTFNTTISNAFISNKQLTTFIENDDEILINRVSGSTGLYRVSKRVITDTVPTNPPGVIMPYAGIISADQPLPAGWLLCNGDEVSQLEYPILFAAIKFTFKDPSALSDNGDNLFALPDLRGRMPLGLDNMGGSPAGRVDGLRAEELGNTGGSQDVNIQVNNLPEHEHDMRASNGDQFYAINDVPKGATSSQESVTYDAPTGTGIGQGLSSSGGVVSSTTGQAMDVMNPFMAFNYIIWTGSV
jgi:microcystin-dependent protein